MRGRWGVVAAALLSVATANGAAKADFVDNLNFEIAGWDGGVYVDDSTGRFDFCMVSRDYQSGVNLGFLLSSETIWVSLYNEAWNMRVDAEFRGFLTVDGRRSDPMTGYVSAATIVDFPLSPDSGTLNALKYGGLLRVEFDGRRYDFNLAGTARAIARLEECVRSYRTYAAAPPQGGGGGGAGGGAAGGGGGAAGTNQNRLALRLEATELITNILNVAGVPGFRIVTDTEERELFGNPDVVWVSEEIVGAATIYQPEQTMDIDDMVAASLLGADGCEGGRNVASRRETIEGLTIAHVAVECIEEGETLYLMSTILPRRPSGFIELSYFYVNGPPGEETFGLGPEALEEAALIVVGGSGPASKAK